MKNQPVAWAYIKNGEFFDAVHPDEHDKYEGMYTTPVYTHPAKTLTDAFIYENHVGYLSPSNDFYAPDYPTWKQDGFTPIYKEPVAKTLTDEEIIEIYNEILIHDKKSSIKFARAILKKASEK